MVGKLIGYARVSTQQGHLVCLKQLKLEPLNSTSKIKDCSKIYLSNKVTFFIVIYS